MLAEAQLQLAICQLVKWRRPLGRLVEKDCADGVEPDRSDLTSADRSTVVAVAWAVTRAARYGLFRPRCLVRALAIQRMLRRHGIVAGQINIGVRTRDGAFQAHAWVEVGGVVVGDTPHHIRTFTRVTDLRLVEL